jgi:hypothetical protein
MWKQCSNSSNVANDTEAKLGNTTTEVNAAAAAAETACEVAGVGMRE